MQFIIVVGIALIIYLIHRMLSEVPVRPVAGKVTSPYGYRSHPVTGVWGLHNGTDFSGEVGTPIKSSESATVDEQFTNGIGGLQLILTTRSGHKLGYAHLSDSTVYPGKKVLRGEVIGYVGQSGQATGPHLHFTVRDPNGEQMDPELYLKSKIGRI